MRQVLELYQLIINSPDYRDVTLYHLPPEKETHPTGEMFIIFFERIRGNKSQIFLWMDPGKITAGHTHMMGNHGEKLNRFHDLNQPPWEKLELKDAERILIEKRG